MKAIAFSALFVISVICLQAQAQVVDLNKFSDLKKAQATLAKAQAEKWAQDNGKIKKQEIDGSLVEIQYIDSLGHPHYYVTDNSVAAASISTNKVYSGGGLGLSLDGSGIIVSEWDGGAVLSTHQEFDSRVTVVDAVATHYHSTHVAGTIMASGVQANAKGMAYAASLRSYDWNYDVSEMASEAANGRLISNHSYGEARGWYNGSWWGNTSVSITEDYLFGFYDDMAHDWDLIAHNAPYFLICKSAGNDRDDVGTGYPPDGPWDCIGNQGVAKNILTIGAVNDIPAGYSAPTDVVSTYFSSWGPADDGRVKPDIVANGLGLYSTYNTNNTSYASLSGTSMSSPSAAGSLALLQQHRHNLTGNYLLASTLKALVIHTADEAGTNDGPDYSNGWGLMNTQKAAQKISADQSADVIGEYTLSNGATYSRDFVATGTEPIKITIVWNDVPGTPPAAAVDPITPMLVNDLDLRITYLANTYYPWKLNRDDPSAAATNSAENNVDNVEVVYIANPVIGATYTIVIDHDGTLSGGSQDFSMIISGMLATVPPIANFGADETSPSLGSLVTLTDLSENIPTSWLWSFNPTTVTFLDGTSATSQHPHVSFDQEGLYSVTLTATNPWGSDSETKTNYVHAYNCTYSVLPQAESFSSTTKPICWEVVDHQGSGLVWQFGPTGGFYTPALTENYAYINSRNNGAGNSQNTDLITPKLDFSNYTNIRLQFNHYFVSNSGSSGTLSYSLNDGGSWTTIQSFTTNTTNPQLFDQFLTALNMQGSVRLKWNYTGTYAWLWAVDDVQITGDYVEVWDGSESSAWNLESNWKDGSMPTVSSNVVIPTTANQPIITAPSNNPAQCNNLTINAGAILTVASESAFTVHGTLTNHAGSSGLVIKSDGSIIHQTTSIASTFERSISAWGPLSSQGWHMLSSPVSNQVFQPDFVSSPPAATEDFYLWRESTNEWVNSKSGPVNGPWTFNSTDFGTAFTAGRGYLAAYNTTGIKSFVGNGTVANVEFPLSYTSEAGRKGWNLCGNPFGSALQWDIETWMPENSLISGVAKILVSATGSYDDILAGELIPPLNGFFVHTNGATNLLIPASARTHGGTWYKSSNNPQITLTAIDVQGQTSQKCRLVQNPNATTEFDRLYDGVFVKYYAPGFYASKNDLKLSTSSIPLISNETSVELGFEKNAGTEYKMVANGVKQFAEQVFLFDRKENYRHNFSSDSVYAFTASDGDLKDRFLLYFGWVNTPENEIFMPEISVLNHSLIIHNAKPCLVQVFDLTGKSILTKEITAFGTSQLNLPQKQAYYMLRFVYAKGVIVKKVLVL